MARFEAGGVISLTPFHSAQAEVARALTPRSVLRCGRRFGKTTLLETVAAVRAIGDNETPAQSVGWFSPNYKLLTPSYKRLLRMIRPAVAHASKTDSLIETITGGQIEFWTLADEEAGRSRAYDLVIIDEAS